VDCKEVRLGDRREVTPPHSPLPLSTTMQLLLDLDSTAVTEAHRTAVQEQN